ncbi:hypothetical protein GCM10018781_77460 [Kitasatospora indigofera]|uniref:Ricin B lectin domain-containing protein n=1 Tax=Kitasatospora indigofera TaxID=67307 RepID=A0A919DAA0_9ACTN|nr:RICIN domain-containing protein [Kitasatospora indigofera]GHE25702.1 hypothetical protein GCM10018781_77460 [Kitasatospora indigofera]
MDAQFLTDNTFTCCQGTGLETQTKLMDSVYFWDDTSLYVNLGGAGHEWWFVPNGERRIQNLNSGLLLGVAGMSMAAGGLVVQWGDNGTADHRWLALRDADGAFRLRNLNSGKVLGVDGASTAAGAKVLQWDDSGTRDHLWRLRHGGADAFRIENVNSGKVLGVTGASTAAGAQVVQWDDSGTRDHLWRFV